MWNSVSARISQNTIKLELETSAIDISDQLLRSQGSPVDWETRPSQNFSLGVVTKNYEIDADKVIEMTKLSYSEIKSLLGIKSHDFYFKVTDLFGNIINQSDIKFEAGAPPTPDSSIVNSRRIVIFKNEIVYIDVITWR